jgi:lipoate-protein ligase A
VVRRPTGGRAVLHDDELTYSVCVPLDGFWGRVSVTESFRLIGTGLVLGLRRLGVAASLGECGGGAPARDRAAACFQMPRMPAVLTAGRKLVGSAQRRWETALLQHGSLLLGVDLEMHQAVFPAWPRDDPSRGVTWLNALLPEAPRRVDTERALMDGWAEVLSVRGGPGDLTGLERQEAERLVVARYGNPAWTWRY